MIDLPVKEFNEMGRYAGVIWKFLFQRAAERRIGQKLPLFLYSDEAQFFVTSTDADFQSTARSACVATVYLTQNLANLYARVRPEYVNSLLGNLQTKLFHQNADKETNHWAAETVSKVFFERSSSSVSTKVDDYSDESTTTGTSTHLVLDYDLQPRAFLELAKGRTPYNHVVTAVLFQGGRVFPKRKSVRASGL